MDNVAKAFTGLAALAFVLAVVCNLMGTPIVNVTAQGFSNASTNLGLIAIALAMTFRGR